MVTRKKVLKWAWLIGVALFGFMTNVALFALLGLGAGTGFSMTIIRRILSLVGSGVGLLLMALKRVKR
jgi:hypothetical protein